MNDNNQAQNQGQSNVAPIQPGSPSFIPFVNSGGNNGTAGSTSVTLSAESGPVNVKINESKGGSQEFGYDAIQRIEQKAEQEVLARETAEMKEGRSPTNRQQPQDDQKQKEEEQKRLAAATAQAKPEFPKFIGNKIADTILENPNEIRHQAGKGDPNKAQTVIYMFLDRLLKKQAAKSK